MHNILRTLIPAVFLLAICICQSKDDYIIDHQQTIQKEFESSNVSRLERFKSDIEVTIRSEGSATAKTIESSLNTTFLDKLNQLGKEVGQLKMLYVLGVLILVANIYLIVNLIN